ncbi:unnamed protein product [Lactuca virosa]|uniref:Uncharacterized protein n=1 Tax=Lactuca virosa TaxID=75947 RepID=A0AAU9NWQ6_9ASTR|nr:unnamed protein product [Lactuca virosa]
MAKCLNQITKKKTQGFKRFKGFSLSYRHFSLKKAFNREPCMCAQKRNVYMLSRMREEEKLKKLGNLINDSHHSCSALFEFSCAELAEMFPLL